MSDFLFDYRSIIYLLLGVTAIVLIALWYQTRKRAYLVALGGVLALALVVLLVDQFGRGETDREQIERKIAEIAASVKDPDAAKKLAAYISNDFVSPGGRKKDAFCKEAAQLAGQYGVQEVIVWDFAFEEMSRSDRTAKVRFQVKVKGTGPGLGGESFGTCLGIFHLDADGQWRLQGFKLYWPPNTTQEWQSPL